MEIRQDHRIPGDGAALVLRVPAIAPDAGPPEEIVQEAKMFREKKLPCDMMIYLGTDFCPNGWNTHNGEFTGMTRPSRSQATIQELPIRISKSCCMW